jgi:hypothetical protein
MVEQSSEIKTQNPDFLRLGEIRQFLDQINERRKAGEELSDDEQCEVAMIGMENIGLKKKTGEIDHKQAKSGYLGWLTTLSTEYPAGYELMQQPAYDDKGKLVTDSFGKVISTFRHEMNKYLQG